MQIEWHNTVMTEVLDFRLDLLLFLRDSFRRSWIRAQCSKRSSGREVSEGLCHAPSVCRRLVSEIGKPAAKMHVRCVQHSQFHAIESCGLGIPPHQPLPHACRFKNRQTGIAPIG